MIKLISSVEILAHEVLNDKTILLENSTVLRRPEVYYAHHASLSRYIKQEVSGDENLTIITFCDVVLNAVRIAVVEGKLSASDVTIEFHTVDGIINPKLYEDGGIDIWPTGFFDQNEIDLLALLKL